MRAQSKDGFTLIELMIVVVVIGILAAMAIPRYNVSAHRSKEKEADVFLSQLYRLQEVYRVEYGVPATSSSDLEKVGLGTPTLRNYTWDGSVAIPLCLASNGAWNSRQIDATGDINDCTPP